MNWSQQVQLRVAKLDRIQYLGSAKLQARGSVYIPTLFSSINCIQLSLLHHLWIVNMRVEVS